jgi:hypothetical protein
MLEDCLKSRLISLRSIAMVGIRPKLDDLTAARMSHFSHQPDARLTTAAKLPHGRWTVQEKLRGFVDIVISTFIGNATMLTLP